MAISKKIKMSLDFKINNTDRTVGAIISNEISKNRAKALPKNTLSLNFEGLLVKVLEHFLLRV